MSANPPSERPAPRSESFMGSLADNALLTWSLRRARREAATLIFALGFVAVLYGITALMAFLILGPTFRGRVGEFLQGVHVLAWSANAVLLLLVVPLRLAQQIAVERERRTLEFLRMTAISKRSLALGAIAAAYSLPLMLSTLSLPLVLAGLFSDRLASPVDALAAYVGLATTSIFYALVAGTVAFIPKKAAQATGGALLSLLGLAGFGAFFEAPYVELAGCFGPWGAILSSWDYSPDRFVVSIFGGIYPGMFLQIPFQLTVAAVLFGVLAEKLGSDDTFAIGVRGGALLTTLGAVLLGITFWEESASHPRPWSKAAAEVLGMRYVVLFMSLLPLAMDSTVLREALVRGLARSRGDPPRRSERVHPFHAPLAATLAAGVMSVILLIGISYFAVAPTTDFQPKNLFLAMVSLVTYIAVAASAFQAARLVAPHSAPNAIASALLLALWLAPLFVTKGLEELDAPLALTSLPLVLSPFPVLFVVASSAVASLPGGLMPPVAMGMASIIVNGLLIAGFQALVHRGTVNAEELAHSLVTLPADAFGVAPGQLSRTCPQGHVFEQKWDSCPHCK